MGPHWNNYSHAVHWGVATVWPGLMEEWAGKKQDRFKVKAHLEASRERSWSRPVALTAEVFLWFYCGWRLGLKSPHSGCFPEQISFCWFWQVRQIWNCICCMIKMQLQSWRLWLKNYRRKRNKGNKRFNIWVVFST